MNVERGLTRRSVLGRITRSGALILLGSCVPTASEQSRAPLPVVGYIGTNPPSDPLNVKRVNTFRDALAQQGLVDGKDFTIDFRWSIAAAGGSGGHPWASDQTADLVAQRARVILVNGSLWRAVRQATDQVPIVALAADVDELFDFGWAASLARPGGNITGLALATRQQSRKLVELIVQCVPQMRRLALLTNVESRPDTHVTVRAFAESLGLDLLVLDVRATDDIGQAFARAREWRAEAVVVSGLVPLNAARGEEVARNAAQSRLPLITGSRPVLDGGGLMYYALLDFEEYVTQRSAWYVARILAGTSPGVLPIEVISGPIRFIVNRRALTKLDLTLPPSVASQVTDWID